MAGQVWTTDALGGFMSAKELSKELRYSTQKMAKFRQLCDAKNAIGKNKGDIFHWNVYSNVAVGGAALSETAPMTETNFTVSQGSLTMTEYGNAVPFTQKLDNFSEHPVREIIEKVLKHDCRDTLDLAAYAQFDATPLRIAPAGVGGDSATDIVLSTTGSTTVVNNAALSTGHIKRIVDLMKERNIPTFTERDYISVARPSTFRNVKDQLEQLHQYTESGLDMIMNGEIGRYEGVRMIEQTNVASEAWTNAKSDGAFFLGQDTVVEGIAVPEEIRGKIPTDFGRSQGVAWIYVGGFGLVHTQAAQARVLKWDSAS